MYMFARFGFCIILMALALASASCNRDVSALNQPPSVSEEESVPRIEEGFYGVGPVLNAKLEQIALADPAIKTLLEGEESIYVIDGHQVNNQNYNLSVGVRITENITTEQFREWMDSGREDPDLITEYVGVLQIGYNTKYDIVFDMEQEIVSELTPREASSVVIPEVTADEKEKALKIALADPTLKQLLEGKKYRIAPDNKIGVWHTGETKLGVAFEISFEIVYTIDAYLPRYQHESTRVTGEVEGLIIDVLLEENRVASIVPISPIDKN